MAFVQHSAPGTTSLSLTGVTAGNSVLVLIAQYSSAIRTYAVADNIAGSYTVDKAYQDSLHVAVHSFHNHPGGDITITVTPSSSANFRAVALEVSGLDAAAAPISSDFTDGANTFTHFSAQVGAIDTAGPAFIVCVGTLNASSGVSGTTAGTNYTKIDSGHIQAFFQYWDAPGAVTDERGQWTHDGTAARTGRSAIVAYPYAALGLSIEGAALASTSALHAGTVSTEAAIAGAHLSSAAALYSGTLGLAIAGTTLASTSALYAGAIAQTVTGAHLASTAQLYTGTLAQVVTGAHLASSSTLAAGAVTLDGALAGATLASTSQLHTGTVGLTVSGAALASSAALYSGAIGLQVSGAALASTSTLTAGSVGLVVAGAHLAAASALYPGTLVEDGVLAGAHLASVSALHSGVVGLTVTGATLASSSALTPGAIGSALGGVHLPSAATLYTGIVGLTITGATLGSAAQLFGGTVAIAGAATIQPARTRRVQLLDAVARTTALLAPRQFVGTWPIHQRTVREVE